MINNEIVKKLTSIDKNYVISGSNATNHHLGYELRQCNDLDVHMTTNLDENSISELLGINVDVSPAIIPHDLIDGVRVMNLEYLIAGKINRISSLNRCKDLYDVYFLLQKDINIDKLKSFLQVNNISGCEIKDNDFNEFTQKLKYKIDKASCINKINDIIKK